MNHDARARNQVDQEPLKFICDRPKNYDEAQEHRNELMAGIIKRFVAEEPVVIDAGCGEQRLKKYFENYHGYDLMFGHNIEDMPLAGEVVVFSDVLEHVTDHVACLDNVIANYCLISLPIEHTRLPSLDHVRRITAADIPLVQPEWELVGKWFWILKPKLWRVRQMFPLLSPFAEEEITLWRLI